MDVKLGPVWKNFGEDLITGLTKKRRIGMVKYWVCRKNPEHRWKVGATVLETQK